jgi:hypothetical protein
MAEFAAYSLEVLSALHLGVRRAGVVARSHRHAPGHLFSHALAAVIGVRRGATPAAFAGALAEVTGRFRFGPAFFVENGSALTDDEVQTRLLASTHHVTLGLGERAALDAALFEVEALHVAPGSAVRLGGGVWFDRDAIDDKPLAHWLSQIRLGGEQKTGLGRVRCADWQAGAKAYPGLGPAGPQGLHCAAGENLSGAALDGVDRSPLVPWLGRRFDTQRGFGRKLSTAALVRINGRVTEAACFFPAGEEPGLGCWTRTT